MSYIRNSFEGEGIDKIVSLQKGGDDDLDRITIGKDTYELGNVVVDKDYLYFDTGSSEECDEEVNRIMKNIAELLPDTQIHHSWMSTCSGMGGSYFFGYMDKEYKEWDDYIYSTIFDVTWSAEGIGDIPEYGEADITGCTPVTVNGKKFSLYDLSYDKNHIRHGYTWEGIEEAEGLIDELAKIMSESAIEEQLYITQTGEINISTYKYSNGKLNKKFVCLK